MSHLLSWVQRCWSRGGRSHTVMRATRAENRFLAHFDVTPSNQFWFCSWDCAERMNHSVIKCQSKSLIQERERHSHSNRFRPGWWSYTETVEKIEGRWIFKFFSSHTPKSLQFNMSVHNNVNNTHYTAVFLKPGESWDFGELRYHASMTLKKNHMNIKI